MITWLSPAAKAASSADSGRSCTSSQPSTASLVANALIASSALEYVTTAVETLSL